MVTDGDFVTPATSRQQMDQLAAVSTTSKSFAFDVHPPRVWCFRRSCSPQHLSGLFVFFLSFLECAMHKCSQDASARLSSSVKNQAVEVGEREGE